MTTEETEVPEAEEDIVVPPVTEEPKSEEEEPKEEKEDFVKGDETVPAAKYNQALRKLREAELEKKERDKQSPEKETPKKRAKEEEDDIFKEESEEDKVDFEALVEAKVKPVLERLNQKEAEERKNQRTAFFEEHPEYLTDAEAWQELLDEVDNFNPHSKDNHYKQLTKAHRIRSAEVGYSDIDKKKKEMASESASKGDGSQKAADRKSSEDEREDRLAKDMPKGFVYKERK